VGEIVETQFGYHLIKVGEHIQPHTVSFDEVKEKLSKYLRTQDRRKAAEDFIEELRTKSKVEIKVAQGPAFEMGMPPGMAPPQAAPAPAPAPAPTM
jgi:parvulin-like peptidyl-prolyl isomerase